jgi:hypothetical protein
MNVDFAGLADQQVFQEKRYEKLRRSSDDHFYQDTSLRCRLSANATSSAAQLRYAKSSSSCTKSRKMLT